MDAALRAGIALYDAGEYHAAHDPWEARWLELEASDDARFLKGLIQATAATHHARTRNWSGATGLATSAGDYLGGLPSPCRDVDLDALRWWIAVLAADPEVVERRAPPPLRHDGRTLDLADLRFEAAALAAGALAAAYDYDEGVIDRAVTFAREEVDGGERTRFTTAVLEFVAADATRAVAYRRLASLVDRRAREYADVDGLFDPE